MRVPRKVRFWVGWICIAAACAGAATVAVLVGVRFFNAIGGVERLVAPATASVECSPGDEWRIGPLTSTTRSYGPVTITDGAYAEVAGVRAVDADGAELDVRSMSGLGSETVTVNGDSYSAALTFTCRTAGTARVEVAGPEGQRFAVFSAIGDVLDGWRIALGLMISSTVFLIAGVAMAVTGRSRLVAVRT